MSQNIGIIVYLSVLAICKFDVSAMWLCRYWFKSPYSPFSNTIHMGSSSRLAPSSRATFRSTSRTSLFASCWNSILENTWSVQKYVIFLWCMAIPKPRVYNMCVCVCVSKIMQVFRSDLAHLFFESLLFCEEKTTEKSDAKERRESRRLSGNLYEK